MSTITTPTADLSHAIAEAAGGNQYTDWIHVYELRVDPTYQRPLNRVRIKRMVAEFNPDAVGVLQVSKRADGEMFIVDGQHRQALLVAVGWQDQKVPCLVHTGLTVEEEARIFSVRNAGSVKPSAIDLYRSRLAENNPLTLEIDRTLRKVGVQIVTGPGENRIQCAGSIELVAEKAGCDTLYDTLVVMREAWGSHSSAFSAPLVTGIAVFLNRYGDKVDRKRLARQLSTVTPLQLRAMSKSATLGQSSTRNATLNSVPPILVALYNKKLRTGHLDPWQVRPDRFGVWGAPVKR